MTFYCDCFVWFYKETEILYNIKNLYAIIDKIIKNDKNIKTQ